MLRYGIRPKKSMFLVGGGWLGICNTAVPRRILSNSFNIFQRFASFILKIINSASNKI